MSNSMLASSATFSAVSTSTTRGPSLRRHCQLRFPTPPKGLDFTRLGCVKAMYSDGLEMLESGGRRGVWSIRDDLQVPRKHPVALAAADSSISSVVLVDKTEAHKPECLNNIYLEKAIPLLMEEFSHTNIHHQVPEIEEVVVDCGMGDAQQNSEGLDAAMKVRPCQDHWAVAHQGEGEEEIHRQLQPQGRSGLRKSHRILRNNVRLRTQRPCVGAKLSSPEEFKKNCPIAKMCGITSAKDAEVAAMAGASLIGMILWPKSKRSVSTKVAKEISKVSRECGAEPVGVFVDDDADTIMRAHDALDLEYVQLHGNNSRAAFPLIKQSRVIYVLHADESGNLLNHITDEESSLVDWLLVDGATGGSGKVFDWKKFRKPTVVSKCGWLLAGGLNPENICEAVTALSPHGVDVSSGICGPDGIKKDPSRISSFMDNLSSLSYHS